MLTFATDDGSTVSKSAEVVAEDTAAGKDAVTELISELGCTTPSLVPRQLRYNIYLVENLYINNNTCMQ